MSLKGSKTEIARQIGNAIPVKFAHAIAKSVLDMIYERDIK